MEPEGMGEAVQGCRGAGVQGRSGSHPLYFWPAIGTASIWLLVLSNNLVLVLVSEDSDKESVDGEMLSLSLSLSLSIFFLLDLTFLHCQHQVFFFPVIIQIVLTVVVGKSVLSSVLNVTWMMRKTVIKLQAIVQTKILYGSALCSNPHWQ